MLLIFSWFIVYENGFLFELSVNVIVLLCLPYILNKVAKINIVYYISRRIDP